MSLAPSYAQVIRERGDESGFLKKLVTYMTARGHLTLIPEIVRILERDPKRKGALVVLARAEDAKKFSKEVKEALSALEVNDADTVIDPHLVGGYLVRGKSKVIDRSYRTALVSIYHKTLS